MPTPSTHTLTVLGVSDHRYKSQHITYLLFQASALVRPIYGPGGLPPKPIIGGPDGVLRPIIPVRPGGDDNGLPPTPIIGGDEDSLPPKPLIGGPDGIWRPIIGGPDGVWKPIIGGPDGIRPEPVKPDNIRPGGGGSGLPPAPEPEQQLYYPVCPASSVVKVPISQLEPSLVINFNGKDIPIIDGEEQEESSRPINIKGRDGDGIWNGPIIGGDEGLPPKPIIGGDEASLPPKPLIGGPDGIWRPIIGGPDGVRPMPLTF